MKRSIIGIAAAAIIVPIVVYAISPYFTESTVDEELPGNVAVTRDDSAMMASDYEGMFVGVGDGIHDARGTAAILPLDDGGQVLRLEDFWATNGPGLRVYLSVDKQASDYVSLGDLKANQGNQNYDIPEGTDLDKYDHVLIWCEPFSVLFGSAELST